MTVGVGANPGLEKRLAKKCTECPASFHGERLSHDPCAPMAWDTGRKRAVEMAPSHFSAISTPWGAYKPG